jgi:SPP1 gp7 family putative phage head morphogenesis protein
MRELYDTQRALIRSLPADAIERLNTEGNEALLAGQRISKADIERIRGQLLMPQMREQFEALGSKETFSQYLTRRATTVARTETARTASVLVQARAEHAGSTEFVWRTAGDWKVRPVHRQHNDKRYPWNNPPQSEPNLEPYLPGQGPNCRCIALPQFD